MTETASPSSRPTPSPQPLGGVAGDWVRRVRGATATRDLLEAVVLLLAAFVSSGVLILLIGRNPVDAYVAVVDSSFGSRRSIGETLESATPLIFAGLAFTVAFRARLLNLGVGSQILWGALAAAWAGSALTLPRPFHITVLLVVGTAAGAAFASVAGALKAYRGVHEVISTIMLEYVALSAINYLVNGPLQDPRDAGLPQTAPIATSAELPRILPPSRLSAGILLAVLVGVVVWWVRDRARIGFEWSAVGTGPDAAAMAGLSTVRATLTAMAVSGGVAGFAGAVLMSGLLHRYQANTSAGLGLTGLAIALLSRHRIGGLFLAGLLFGALAQGQRGLQRDAGVPQDMVLVIQGFIVFFVAAPQLLWAAQRRWHRRSAVGVIDGPVAGSGSGGDGAMTRAGRADEEAAS